MTPTKAEKNRRVETGEALTAGPGGNEYRRWSALRLIALRGVDLSLRFLPVF